MNLFKFNRLIIIAGILLIISAATTYAQTSDTVLVETTEPVQEVKDTPKAADTTKEKEYRPGRAAMFSAILPGLGQIYNKRWWKLPIVYAALGTTVYFAVDNTIIFNDLRNSYLARTGDPNKTDKFPNLSDDALKLNRDQFKRYRDLSYFLVAIVYALNIVDAAVDAHLKGFDVSDDLSFNIKPSLIYTADGGSGTGLTVALTF